jgi:endonuclease YncB( thermonuclease family)
MEVFTGKGREIIHAACLDAPETAHKFAELGWFGRAALSAVELGVEKGDEICLTEHVPAIRDAEGHRVLYVTVQGDRDYTGGVIAGGLGLLRSENCGRATYYRRLEDQAIAKGKGLWGEVGVRPAFSATQHSLARAAGPAPPRARRSGGG